MSVLALITIVATAFARETYRDDIDEDVRDRAEPALRARHRTRRPSPCADPDRSRGRATPATRAVHHGGLDALGDALGREADLVVQQRGRAVGDVAVGQADAQDPRREAAVAQALPDGGAEAARQHALLDRHEQVVLGGELGQQPGVQRLGEAGVGDRDVEPALGEQIAAAPSALPHAGAVADERDALALAQDLAGADPDRLRLGRAARRRRPRRAGSGSPPGRRRGAAPCGACGRASPRRAAPSA